MLMKKPISHVNTSLYTANTYVKGIPSTVVAAMWLHSPNTFHNYAIRT